MATRANTRNKQETEAPAEPTETDVEASAPAEVEVPATETDIPVLPDDYTPEHPLVAEMLSMVKSAEEHKDDPTPIADFVAAADRLFKVDTGFALVEALGTDIDTAVATYSSFKGMVDTLRGSIETVDRAVGDNLAEGLEALAKVPMGGIDSEADKTAIPVITARWRASKPKAGTGTGTARTGQSDIPFLEWRVRFTCGTCQKKFSTRKDNLNSARNECIKHSRTHGQNKAEGTNDYQELTNGLYLTGLGNPTFKGEHVEADKVLDSVQRGGWTFTRHND